jgi:hypothetical protein
MMEAQMNIAGSRNDHHLLYGTAAALLLISCALADAGIVAWSAALVTAGQVAAAMLAFILIGLAALFTVWYIRG